MQPLPRPLALRPFYRSRLFWFGVPVLAFLLWGWWFSMRNSSGVEFAGSRNWGLGQFSGDVHAVWNPEGLPDWQRFRAWQFKTPGLKAGESTVPFTVANPTTNRYASIPYHAVVVAYASAWLLTLAWLQRRKSRLMTLHAAP